MTIENVVNISPGASATGTSDTPVFADIEPCPEVKDGAAMRDESFIRALQRLQALRDFLQQVSIASNASVQRASQLGGLNQLRRSALPNARHATFEEWSQVELRSAVIWSALTEVQRRRFLSTQTPIWLIYLMVGLFVVAMASLGVGSLVGAGRVTLAGWLLLPFLVWTGTLATMGAASFIGMNALSVQDDATFDLSSSKLIWMRLLLGVLFGTVLTIPFGYQPFSTFMAQMQTVAQMPTPAQFQEAAKSAGGNAAQALKQSTFLLLPFVLGFSTSVVILVLNRLIEGVQTFFGKGAAKT